MSEEKKGVTNGPANSEMAPQEDGTKVPLTNDEAEVKFTSSNNPPNGDAKIDVGTAQPFSGLSKEDLMKYADDPFWVRLRWILFILFWAGWVAMLVLAIVIIVQAPRCEAKKTLDWVQESAMIQYDVNKPIDADGSGDTDSKDVIKMASDLGMTTVYMKDLIDPLDFSKINGVYVEEDVKDVLKGAKEANLHVVTDFVPAEVDTGNSWYLNASLSDFFIEGTNFLNFSNPNLLNALDDLLSGTWNDMGIQGFLVPDTDDQALTNASITLNEELQDVDGAVVDGMTDMSSLLNSQFDAQKYQAFLEEHIDDWSYFEYNPKQAESVIDSSIVQLITLSVFMVPGTPIVNGLDEAYFSDNSLLMKAMSEFREKESVQVGNMTFTNSSEDVVAYARVLKGTPGYAVAVNLHSDNSTLVNFTSIEGVPEKGINQLKLLNATLLSEDLGSSKLDAVPLGPYEGIVIEFVPDL